MGRKAYEIGLKEGRTSPYPLMRQILFSRTMESSPDEAVELVRKDIPAFVRALKSETHGPGWLCGGAEVASTLMQAGLMDNLVVKLNPVVFGSGVPLSRNRLRQVALRLKGTMRYGCGIVVLRYARCSLGDG